MICCNISVYIFNLFTFESDEFYTCLRIQVKCLIAITYITYTLL